MIVDYITLDFHPLARWVGIRELCGEDEQSVAGTGTMEGMQLIDRLLTMPPDQAGQISSATMAAADRDKILEIVYTRTYGAKVEATARCSQCSAAFDLDFSLKNLRNSLTGSPGTTDAVRQDDGTFLLPSGHRFRLPTGEDEIAVMGLASGDATERLLKGCVLEGDPESCGHVIQDAMADLAPMFEAELAARCPECSAEQNIAFDIQSFLLKTLQTERNRLAWEVHRLASAYGWGLSEILSLPRSVRRIHVELIEREMPSRRRAAL